MGESKNTGESNSSSPNDKDLSAKNELTSANFSNPATGTEKSTVGNIEKDLMPLTSPAQQEEIQSNVMEVHHHAHLDSPKKWKGYLFQFLMLFLAVFCGFLAEYQLEHVIENRRERQFMQSMLVDIEKDRSVLSEASGLMDTQVGGLDSLAILTSDVNLRSPQVWKTYELQRKYIYLTQIPLVDRTETQLKHSGGMRMIRNKRVADSIVNYWTLRDQLHRTFELVDTHRTKAKDLSFLLFNNKYYVDEGSITDFHFIGEPVLMTKDPSILLQFSNRIAHMKDVMKYTYKSRINRLAQTGESLTEVIKKEYGLE